MNPQSQLIRSYYLIMFFSLAVPLHSSVTKEFTLAELVAQSSHIAQMEVVSIQSFWNEDSSRILSEIVLKNLHDYTGKFMPGEHVNLLYPGGTKDGITTFVVEFPSFEVGEKALLFLSEVETPHPRGFLKINGLSQGKFKILVQNDIEVVIREKIATPLVIGEGGDVLSVTSHTAMPLSKLIGAIGKQTEVR